LDANFPIDLRLLNACLPINFAPFNANPKNPAVCASTGICTTSSSSTISVIVILYN
jgi:hypothetical protein